MTPVSRTLRPPTLPGLLRGAVVLVAAVTLGAALLVAPARADDGAPAAAPDALELAFEGRLADAIQAAQAAFAAAPDARTGRLLQDLLLAAGRAGEWTVPASAPAHVRDGLAARRLEPKEAAAALGDVLDVEGASGLFRLDLAYALLGLGRFTTARSEAERFLKDAPEDPEGHLVLARVLRASDKGTLALRSLARVLELHPGHPDAAAERAALLAAEGEPGAREVLVAALAVYPGNTTLRLALAEDQVRAGELEAATTTLEGLLTMAGRHAAVHVLLAEVWRLRRDPDKSAASAAAALASPGVTVPERVRALRAQGFAKQKKDDLPGACADYRAALALDPESAQLHADLGFAHALAGEHERAEEALERALKLDKKLTDAHRKQGIAWHLAGDARKAKRELEIVLKDEPNDIAANRILGYLLLDEGKADKAMKHFRTVADLEPADASSVRMIGRCLMALGQLPKAVQMFRDAIDRNPKDGFCHFDLGRALEEQELFADAEASYRKAVEVDERLSHAHLYLAELLHYVQDKPKEALVHYKRFLELGGRDEDGDIQQRIEQLES